MSIDIIDNLIAKYNDYIESSTEEHEKYYNTIDSNRKQSFDNEKQVNHFL